VQDASFVRKSLFFQIDGSLDNSERILVNTAYLDKPDDETMMLLGFGLPGDYAPFPQTGLECMPLTGETGRPLLKWAAGKVKGRIKRIARIS
jgi:hypothetical protein